MARSKTTKKTTKKTYLTNETALKAGAKRGDWTVRYRDGRGRVIDVAEYITRGAALKCASNAVVRGSAATADVVDSRGKRGKVVIRYAVRSGMVVSKAA
jgi:hypothetical protein